jgi:hypothetical protein
MAVPLLLRGIPLLRLQLHHHRLAASIFATPRRPWCTAAEPTRADESLSPADNATAAWSARDPPKHPRWEDVDYRQWKDKEEEILRDIEPITALTKEILHSDRLVSLPLDTPKTFVPQFFLFLRLFGFLENVGKVRKVISLLWIGLDLEFYLPCSVV